MKQVFVLIFVLFFHYCTAQPPIAWNKLLGGNRTEIGRAFQQTSDGGFIIAGSSNTSPANGDVSQSSRGAIDYWIVKLNTNGNKTWDKRFGGYSTETPYSIQQTNDGGYIIAGVSYSSEDGDVSGINHGSSDYWIVKLDADGNKVWDKLLGGSENETAYSIKQTSDGGYIVIGESGSSSSGDVSGINHGIGNEEFIWNDCWVVKLDANGNKVWDKLLGGNLDEEAYCVQQTSDGGYIIAASTSSSANGDVTASNYGINSFNWWIVKLDANGNKTWDKLLGGTPGGFARSIRQTTDGGYIVAGMTYASANGNVSGINHGNGDYWIVKLDSDGNKTWDKLLGGNAMDYAWSVQQTSEGGYIVAGTTSSSSNGDVSGTNHGDADYWIVKLDEEGNKTWDQVWGGDKWDGSYGLAIIQTDDGEYAIVGDAASSANGDVTETTNGDIDIWMIKTGTSTLPVSYNQPLEVINKNGEILLLWSTATEINNSYFEIQRSIDGVNNWLTVGKVESYFTNGNGNGHHYQFKDNHPSGEKVYYRLQQVDIDGKYSYSPVVSIRISKTAALRIYPNPVSDVLLLQSNRNGKQKLSIFDGAGKMVQQQVVEIKNNTARLNISHLPHGQYFIVADDVQVKYTKRFIKIAQ